MEHEPGSEIVEAVVVQEVAPSGLFGTDDPVEVIERATKVADALRDVISKRKLFTMIQRKEHVQVEGWQLVGQMLGVTAVCVDTVEVDGGWKATVEARTVDGRVIGRADALCTKHEKRGPWKTADDYARLSMAQTRATSKALKGPLGFVVSLAGYSSIPAEEMTFVEPDKPVTITPPAGPLITKKVAKELAQAASAFGLMDKLQLAASHVAGVDVGDCSNVTMAVESLSNHLTADDAGRLTAWMDRKADAEGVA